MSKMLAAGGFVVLLVAFAARFIPPLSPLGRGAGGDRSHTHDPNPTEQTSAEKAKGTWHTLFNGVDLTGWWHVGGGHAKVEGGLLTLENDAERRPGYLVSAVQARDFEARLVCRIEQGDSGFFYRSRPEGRTPTEIAGPQVQLNAMPDRGLGGIFEQHGRGWVQKPTAALNHQLLEKLDWITCTIQVQGEQVRVSVNDRLVVQMRDCAPVNKFLEPGSFALQIHGGGYCRVLFREISVRVLDQCSAETPRVRPSRARRKRSDRSKRD